MKKKNKNKIKNSTELNSSVLDLENEVSTKDVSTEPDVSTDVDGKSEVEITDTVNKNEDLPTQISNLKLGIQQEIERRLRLMAEYENYRKRTQSDYQRIYETAGARVIMKLLPIIDDFQRFLDQDITHAKPKVLQQGIDLIYKKLLESLASENVKPIESLGTQFDADIHEAIAQLEDESKSNGIILAEVERGYLMGTKVLRHPKVVVNSYTEKEVESNNE